MASARFWMVGVVVFVVALSALEAYQWNGGPEDKAKITACVGGSVSLPWSIVMGRDGETMLGRDWWFQAPDREKTQIATYESKHFYATENSRVDFLPNAGLSLRDARPQDSGNYSVQVKLRNNRTLASVYRTVTLTVTDRPPATQDGALYVTLSDAVRDDVTENWSLQLHCGQFVDLGHPPVDVIWKTPSGEVKTSSYQDNGTFVLSVSSPVQGGNYFCRLALSASAASCLTATSQLNATAQIFLDDNDAMLSLLNARQREQEQAIEDQANLLEHQAMQISQQKETMADMVQVNKDQANLLEHQAMQISQQKETMADMVQVNKDQANLLEHQAMQISQQKETMADMVQVNKDQANLLEHQAMQISQQKETMADMVQVNKDQANLLQHQALQISQQNETMTDMVQVNKDQALQLHEQSLYQNQTISELTKLSCLMRARNTSSCADWLAVDPVSGIHTVCLSGESVSVYCDQTTDNGGWTVFQRRQDASVDFYRNWADYRNGFGDLEGNFWLGLDKLHKLTTSQRFELRVDLQKCDGTKGNATYSGFYVEDVSHNFTLRFDKFTGGNAGDSLSYHRGLQFSTKDRDHDTFSGKSCAQGSHGAWWYGYCSQSDLNSAYNPNNRDGIYVTFVWNAFSSTGINALKFSEMKIRPI